VCAEGEGDGFVEEARGEGVGRGWVGGVSLEGRMRWVYLPRVCMSATWSWCGSAVIVGNNVDAAERAAMMFSLML